MLPYVWVCLVFRHKKYLLLSRLRESLRIIHGTHVSGPRRVYDLCGKIRQKQEK